MTTLTLLSLQCCKIDNAVTSLPVRICQKQGAVYLFLSDILHPSVEIRHLVRPSLSLRPASCDKTSTDSLFVCIKHVPAQKVPPHQTRRRWSKPSHLVESQPSHSRSFPSHKRANKPTQASGETLPVTCQCFTGANNFRRETDGRGSLLNL